MTYVPVSQNTALASPPPASGSGRGIAWIVILISIAFIFMTNRQETRLTAAAKATSTLAHVDPVLQIIGRYAVGVNAMLSAQQAGASPTAILIPQLDKSADSYADKLAVVVVIGELQGKQAALDRLNFLQQSLPPPLQADAYALREIYAAHAAPPDAAGQAGLRERLGWFGDLALTFAKPATDPQRRAVLAAAARTTVVLAAAALALLVIALAGISLMVWGLVRYADRKLQMHYIRPSHGGPYLEAFAIYIGGLAAAVWIAPRLPSALRHVLAVHIALMLLPTIVAICWPIVRGAADWRAALGWHAGRGALREIGCGITGYLAAFPLLAVGFMLTLLMIKLSRSTPTHPIDQLFGGSAAMTTLIYLLASVYAPITEETMFRGAFFGALRSRHGWFWSAMVSSFVFAAIHPQGWSVIPALMSIAIALAAIREWRGSIISSATAHCLHNTLLVTFATLALQ